MVSTAAATATARTVSTHGGIFASYTPYVVDGACTADLCSPPSFENRIGTSANSANFGAEHTTLDTEINVADSASDSPK